MKNQTTQTAPRSIDTLTVTLVRGRFTSEADALAHLTGRAQLEPTGLEIESTDGVSVTSDESVIASVIESLTDQLADHIGVNAKNIDFSWSIDHNDDYTAYLRVEADDEAIDLRELGKFELEAYELFEISE